MLDTIPETIADDRLEGIKAISGFLGQPKRRTQYLIDKGVIPHGREGRRIVCSKRALLAYWQTAAVGGRPAEAAA